MSQATKVPDIPVADTSPTGLKRFMEAVREVVQVREGRRGDALDKAVTYRDLMASGLATTVGAGQPGGSPVRPAPGLGGGGGGSGGETPEPDLTPPPSATGLTVTAGFATLLVQWLPSIYAAGGGHAYTELWGAQYAGTGPKPTFANAVLLSKEEANIFSYAAGLGRTYHFWLLNRTKAGIAQTTPTGGTNGVAGTTAFIGNADLAPLVVEAGNLAVGAVDLGSSKVTGTITDPARFGALAVGYTVTQYLVAMSGVMANLVVDNAQISNISAAKLTAGDGTIGGTLKSANYVYGIAGWRIQPDGQAWFNGLYISGNSYFDGQVIVRRPDGSIMLQSGGKLSSSDVNPAADWLNSNVVIPRGALNADPELTRPDVAWDIPADVVVDGPSVAPGALGIKYLSCSAGGSNRIAWIKETVPLSALRRFNLSSLLLTAPGNNRAMYLVVRMYRADGAEYGSDGSAGHTGWGGSYAGYVFGGIPTSDNAWHRYGGDFGAGVPGRAIPADVAYCRIGVWFQYSDGASSVQQAAADLRLVDVTDVRLAEAAASAAQTTANSASSSATAALNRLTAIDSDGVLSRGEKPEIIKAWLEAVGERSGIVSQANTFGIGTERDAYTNAYDALSGYLSGLSPAYNDTSSDTPINAATDRGAWTTYYMARQTLLNKIADEAGKRSSWVGVGGRPKMFVARATGALGAAPAGWANGLFNEAGAMVGNAPMRSYVLRELSPAGDLVYTNSYDVYGEGAYAAPDGTHRSAGTLAGDLNYICDNRRGNIVVISTFDEPQGHRMDSGLPAAMYRCGASRAVFGSPLFQYRSAYLLVGIAGCGEGNGAEKYAGDVGDDPNAWCELSFQLFAGALNVTGSNSGARSLVDYGYVGALDATNGAPAGSLVAGDPAQSVVRPGNPITPSNSAALVVNGAIRAEHISVNTLAAVSAWTGTLDVDPWGHIRAGNRNFGGGVGYYLGLDGGEWAMALGDGNTYLRYKQSTGLEIKLPPFTASLNGGDIDADIAPISQTLLGSRTLTLTGGTPPFLIKWGQGPLKVNGSPVNPNSIVVEQDPSPSPGPGTPEYVHMHQAGMSHRVQLWGMIGSAGQYPPATSISTTVTATVTDFGGRTAIVAFNVTAR